MFNPQQQLGAQGNVNPQQQELAKVISQTVWNLRELEGRIGLLKQEVGVLCQATGIPPHVVGLTSPFGTLGPHGTPGSFAPFGSVGAFGATGSPFAQGYGTPTMYGPYTGQGVPPTGISPYAQYQQPWIY